MGGGGRNETKVLYKGMEFITGPHKPSTGARMSGAVATQNSSYAMLQ